MAKTQTKPSSAAPAASNTDNDYAENPAELQETVEDDTTSDLSLEEALRMFGNAKRYIDTNFRQLWDDCYSVYKRKRVKRDYEGMSDPVIPEAFTIIETLVAEIAGGDISFHFQRTNEEQAEDTSVLNGMLDYFMYCNQMGLKNQEWVRDMLLYGTGILHVSWKDSKPFIENIPLRDFFVDPNATAMTLSGRPVARWAGYQYLIDRYELDNTMIYDPEQDKMVPKYKNLQDIGLINTNDSSSTQMDKLYKDMFQGSTLGEDAMKDQVHVIRLYDLNSGKLMEIGNKKAIIYYDDIPYQREEMTKEAEVEVPGEPDPATGEPTLKTMTVTQKLDEIEPFIPIAVLRDYVDTSLFYGEGEMAVMLDRAENLNDYEAMDIDNTAYQNTPMYQIDPQFADLAPEIETIAGAVYPIPKGAISPLERPQLGESLDIKKDRIIQQMRAATAADEAVQGISQDKGRVTATEVSTEIGQAKSRFSTKLNNLQDEGYAQLGTIIFKMVQIFTTEKTVVRVVGPQGTHFKDYDPWEYNGEWEPHVELDSTTRQKQLEVGQKLNQVYQLMQASPIYDPVEVQRFILQHIDPDLSDEKFNSMLAKTQAGPSAEEQKMQMELQKAELMATAEIYRWATPFIQAQIEQILKMQPDPQHEVDEQHNAVMMGAKQADLLNPHTDSEGNPDPSVGPMPGTPPPGLEAPQPAAAPA